MTNKNFYITTPIYYVNGAPHIGHAYTSIAADIMARFKRLDGYDVHFLTGTDEHGLKVKQAAEAAGKDPQSFTDELSEGFRALTPLLDFTNDDFIRTTEDRHKKGAQALWTALADAGHIYKDTYAGWYAVRDEAYYDKSELIEHDGHMIAPSGAECQWMEEESYFFKLSEFQDKLLAFYEENPDFIAPAAARNEVISFVKSGLKDLSISRTTFDWGVKVPGDEAHIMYVWIDALANYITALGYPETDGKYGQFWPADVHLVGKDILRFHAIYWPAFLMGAELELPKRIFANGWWMAEGQKMSKSIGNVIAPKDLVERYGVDATRFVLFRDVPYGNDGNFSHGLAIQRINNDLANGLGNLAQRTLSFIAKNCEGTLPQPDALNEIDQIILDLAQNKLLPRLRAHMDVQAFHKALDDIFHVVDQANGYIDSQAPWALKKTDTARMKTVLYVLCEVIRCISISIQPFIPHASSKILNQLSVEEGARSYQNFNADSALKPGASLPEPEGVFPRLKEDEAAA